jgi:hypothetical protein
MPHLNSDIRNKIWGLLLEMHAINIVDNQIISIDLPPEEVYGELQVYKQNLLPVTLSISRESREYTIRHWPYPIASGQGIIGQWRDIIFFDWETMKDLELHHTGPLQRAACVKIAAIQWRCVSTLENIKETLMLVYSRLRNIDQIVIAVDRYAQACRKVNNICDSHRTNPLGIYEIPSNTVLTHNRDPVEWTFLGKMIQQTIKNQAFWRECNRRYALEQISAIRMNPPVIPRICLMLICRDCGHEGRLAMPAQDPELAQALAPTEAEVDELYEPVQPEGPVLVYYEEEGKKAVNSLQDLLD